MPNEADTCRECVVPKLCAQQVWYYEIPLPEGMKNCNLDRKNPRAKENIAHLPPAQLAASILEKERKIIVIMERIKELLEKKP